MSGHHDALADVEGGHSQRPRRAIRRLGSAPSSSAVRQVRGVSDGLGGTPLALSECLSLVQSAGGHGASPDLGRGRLVRGRRRAALVGCDRRVAGGRYRAAGPSSCAFPFPVTSVYAEE